MTHGDSWPPPHPSPPEPPARGSGIPGAPPSRAPYVVGAGAVLAVVAVVALAVVLLTGGDDEPEERTGPTPTVEVSESETASAPAYTCWDGSPADAIETCTAPTGAEGLAWVFPGYADAKCGQAQEGGDPGVVTRVLCIRKLSSGVNVQLGYYQWAGVAEAQAFYDAQGLTRTDGPELIGWSGVSGKRAKAATLYVAQPYSVTITHPASYTLTAEDQAVLAPRPVAEVTGVAG